MATGMNVNRWDGSGSSRTRANATQPYNGLVTKRSCITLWLRGAEEGPRAFSHAESYLQGNAMD